MNMNLDSKNKNAIVFGGTAGIGRASAMQLAAMGASITIVARNEEKLKATIALLPKQGNQTHAYLLADFTSPAQLKEQVTAAASKKNYHILLNNTGGPKDGPIFSADTSEFINAFSMHLECNQILVQALVSGMKEDAYGRIINVISTSVKQPIDRLGVSNTVRGAVASWSKTLANELGQYGITVNNVLPGFTVTDRLASIISNAAKHFDGSEEKAIEFMKSSVPAKRFAQPEEVANAIAFLATDAAGYINGINLPVDGGKTASL